MIRDLDRNIAAERGSGWRCAIVIEMNRNWRIIGGADEFAIKSVWTVNVEMINALFEIAERPRVFQMAAGGDGVVADLDVASASACVDDER